MVFFLTLACIIVSCLMTHSVQSTQVAIHYIYILSTSWKSEFLNWNSFSSCDLDNLWPFGLLLGHVVFIILVHGVLGNRSLRSVSFQQALHPVCWVGWLFVVCRKLCNYLHVFIIFARVALRVLFGSILMKFEQREITKRPSVLWMLAQAVVWLVNVVESQQEKYFFYIWQLIY